MNVKTNSQSWRVAPWQEMHVCLFIFLLSFTYTCLEGVFWLYTGWWGFLSWRAAYARDVVGLPTWGLLWNPRALPSFMGRLIFQAPWGTPRGCFSVITLSWYSCGAGQVEFLLFIQYDDRGDLKVTYMHILLLVSSFLTQVQFCPGNYYNYIVKPLSTILH